MGITGGSVQFGHSTAVLILVLIFANYLCIGHKYYTSIAFPGVMSVGK